MNFVQALQYCIDKNFCFAAYRLPYADAVRLVVQRNPVPLQVKICRDLFEMQGFLISPFIENDQNTHYLIRPDLNYISNDYIDLDALMELDPVPDHDILLHCPLVSKKEFLSQVEETKRAIGQKIFKKAVLARVKNVKGDYRGKLTELFQLLRMSYPNAFVYLFNACGNLWMGATPEPLLCSRKNELESVSLAGTRSMNDENLNLHNWSFKERMEQELVTRFIEESLEKLRIPYLSKTGPYTKKAGNLIHLRTDFLFDFHEVDGKIDKLVKKLHPTSAVCGLPKKASMEFILQTEKHNRSYYSGFLGPLNLDERLLLFVNLRCMQILPKQLLLHVGAGITADSIAEEEWNETELKAETLLSVIDKV
ncbi:MAG TPA: chorismate-binding protein [Prolixibacteraceae bacterium]|nr:chorismate-binding protein [Prolixibacteraceae bacterium]